MTLSRSQLEVLHIHGCRLTKVKQALFDIFAKKDQLYTVADLQTQLTAVGLTPNKTTLYRELTSLTEMGIIEELLLQGNRAYTAAHHEHHHHLICTNCRMIVSLDTPALEKAIHTAETTASQESGFAIDAHEVTLFGRCRNCQ